MPEIYRTLCSSGWSAHAYEVWLGDALIHHLLGDAFAHPESGDQG